MLKDIDEGGKQIIKNPQLQMDYLFEKVQILEEIIFEHTGKETVSYSDKQKKRLAVKGKQLNEFLLGEIETGFAPGTIIGWYRQLVGRKYNSVGQNQKKRGRKPVSPEIVDKTLELAKMNPSWGYDRIAGVLVYLGFQVTASTVRKILDDYGIVPDPEKR